MTRSSAILAMAGILCLSSCAKKESTKPPNPEAPAAQPGGGPHAVVHLKDGSKVPGTIVASSQTDMIVAGDDGIERKIPMAQVKSVEYGEAQPRSRPSKPAASLSAQDAGQERAAAVGRPPRLRRRHLRRPRPGLTSCRREARSRCGRTRRSTRHGGRRTDVRGSGYAGRERRERRCGDSARPTARVVIKSASKGGRFRGTSDLVLDLQTVTINGRQLQD